ncbi:MAG: penicillin-binding protein [Bacteroidales bacterium]|nr:penicillin-binding protein [Bacteroidales bacterium]
MNEKKTGVQQENTMKRDRVGIILMLIHFVFLVASAVLIVQTIKLELFYKPDPKIAKYLKPAGKKLVTDPDRGAIMAMDGRLLASSTPMYDVYMDCTVQKEAYREMRNRHKGDSLERVWIANARELSKGLASTFKDRTADQYYNLIVSSRANNRKYVCIQRHIDHGTLQEIKKLPLFNMASHKGGLMTEKIDTRQYPYGALARRVIGSVRNNTDNSNNLIGLEGKYNYILHGKEGVEWLKKSDAKGWIHNFDSTTVKAENGLDIRTTIDIDMQDIVDKALRQKIMERENIEGGCAIIMDVASGAIRAMVNLKKDGSGIPRETYNYAIGRSGDPGSVFKLSTLMTLIEDGNTTLDSKIPMNRGIWTYKGQTFRDEYLQKRSGTHISVIDGFKISSNNVFRQLACEHYGSNPEHFIHKLYEYKLAETFDFDIIGLASPVLVTPDSPAWSGTALPSIAIGYTVNVTPLHIAMFYNAVANKGKMMKPYLVESFERLGKVEQKLGPVILNGSICSKATADTLTRALKAVTNEGTGRELKNAKCQVAGKTGTAQIPFVTRVNGKDRVVYKDAAGNRQHQATFVGFFPADAPKYTAIVVLYSKLSTSNLYGAAAIPAFKTIVNEIYALDNEWGQKIKNKGDVPLMPLTPVNAADYKLSEIPSVSGMGLMDALYTIENCGYRCVFEGTGHVVGQTPKAGTKAKKGDTVKIVLQ